jgi:hypothetical protein
MARLSVWRAALIVLWCLAPGTANAGPPFRTDDPVPVEFGHYEFYTFSTGTIASKDKSGALPSFELNYGLIPNGQLTIDAPVAFDSPSGGPTRFGYGDTDLSFKYRFIQEDKEGSRPQVAVFPLVQLPTGDENRGLGAGHVLAFLPIWVQKRALAIGPPMGAAVIGSTKAASVTRTIGFLAGYSSGRSRTNSL